MDKLVINQDNWFQTNEAIVKFFSQFLRCMKIQLAYVMRDEVDVPAATLDPPNYYTLHWDNDLTCLTCKNAYCEAQDKVLQLLVNSCRNDASCTIMEEAMPMYNGQEADKKLYDQYLGPIQRTILPHWPKQSSSHSHTPERTGIA
jgi:hypothetical protein